MDTTAWTRGEDLIARLSHERQELRGSCTEWIQQLDRTVRQQLQEQQQLLLEAGRASKLQAPQELEPTHISPAKKVSTEPVDPTANVALDSCKAHAHFSEHKAGVDESDCLQRSHVELSQVPHSTRFSSLFWWSDDGRPDSLWNDPNTTSFSQQTFTVNVIEDWGVSHESQLARHWSLERIGFWKCMEKIQTMVEVEARCPGHAWVYSNGFQIASNILLLLNGIFIGLCVELEFQSKLSGVPIDPLWMDLDRLFNICFVVELIAKFLAGPFHFCFTQGVAWNLLEFILVVLWFVKMSGGLNLPISFHGLRLLRNGRLVLWISKQRGFGRLRIIVLGIIASIKSLASIVVVMAAFIYTCAVLTLTQIVQQWDPSDDNADEQIKLYGSITQTMLTLFMTINGGIDWQDAFEALGTMNWTIRALFLTYIVVMWLGILNVVIGSVVAAVSDIRHDKGVMVDAELERAGRSAKAMAEFFRGADADRTGLLSWEQFESYISNDEVKASFHALEMDAIQARALFDLLDDGSSSVVIDALVSACMHLRKEAKSLDVKLLMYQNELSMNKLAHLSNCLKDFTREVRDIGLREDLEKPLSI